jgi:hypothetical protein
MRQVIAKQVTTVNIYFQFYLIATVGLSVLAALLIIVYHILAGQTDQ